MEFQDITESYYPHPGEYIFYVPNSTIVLCGAFMGDRIKVLHNGRVVEDKVENFKKIKLNKTEKRDKFVPRCKACGS
tara:strand:+ start:979 stop:1209 length:231 start_codon:yes stop_codon:yes gene_type:complete